MDLRFNLPRYIKPNTDDYVLDSNNNSGNIHKGFADEHRSGTLTRLCKQVTVETQHSEWTQSADARGPSSRKSINSGHTSTTARVTAGNKTSLMHKARDWRLNTQQQCLSTRWYKQDQTHRGAKHMTTNGGKNATAGAHARAYAHARTRTLTLN